MPDFMFATGIENSSPTIRPDGRGVIRRDEMAECGHYERWEEDFQCVRDLGIQFLRYGVPYYKVHLGPGKFDWEFSDRAFHRLRELQITPIADLCHFGVPDWIGGFDNPDFPKHLADYAGAFARRYPWIRLFTPVNEIYITAMFSGLLGWWNERQTSDRGFVTALHHCCRGNVMAMHEILKTRSDARFIQSESSEYYHIGSPDAEAKTRFLNERRYLSLDLTYGRTINAGMYEYLLDNGMSREEYHWFGRNQLLGNCIMGNDYYATNEHLVNEDGSITPSGEIIGYYVITRYYYTRYRVPVMHTETNTGNAADATRWLWKEWASMHRLKQDGVPILGFTWYSLTDQIDWDTALREMNHRVIECGLFDLNRNPRPVAKAYKSLIAQWRDVLPTATYGLRVD